MNISDTEITILTNHFIRMVLQDYDSGDKRINPYNFGGSKIALFRNSDGWTLKVFQPDDAELKQAVTSFDFPEIGIRADKLDLTVELSSCIRDSLVAWRSKTAGSAGGRKSSANLTPEQRRERAKKAVAARIAKYGQKTTKE